MDNASKALIMAGAILIAVAIVGIGIYIFSASNSLTNNAVDEIDSIAVQMYNNTFYQYASDGESINGTRAEQLYNAAVAKNVLGDSSPTTFDPKLKYTITYVTNNGYVTQVKISSGT